MLRGRLPSDYLSDALGALGRHVGTHPKAYIAATLLATAVFTVGGWLTLDVEMDLDELYYNHHSQSARGRKVLDEHFPLNYSAYQPDRVPFVPATADIIFEPRTSAQENLFEEQILREILEVENRVRNMTVRLGDRAYTYEDVCARWRGSCYETATTKLLRLVDQLEYGAEGAANVDWPLFVAEVDGVPGFSELFLPEGLGSVVTDGDGVVRKVKAVKSTFHLRLDGERQVELSRAWQAEFLKLLRGIEASRLLEHTRIVYDEDQEIHRLLASNAHYILVERGYLTALFCTLVSVLAFMTGNPVTSKPILGVVAVTCCGMATVAAFGILFMAGCKFFGLLASVPFLTMGIGVDDTFIIVAGWHMSDKKLSVPQRLAHAYREAAVSITLTTVTDVLGYAAGLCFSFPGFSQFSLFSALAIGLTYVYVLLFFGAFLALTGRAESEGRHCLTLKRVDHDSGDPEDIKSAVKSQNGLKSWIGSLAEGVTRQMAELGPKLRSTYIELLHNWMIRMFICVTFIAYVGGEIYGMVLLETVTDYKVFAPRDGMHHAYLISFEKHFLEFPPPVQLVISGDLDYSNETIQRRIEDMLQGLEASEHFRDSLFTQSWLRSALSEVESRAELGGSSAAVNISNEDSFVRFLQEVQFEGGDNMDALDVHIVDGRIKASRFLILPTPLSDFNSFGKVLTYLQDYLERNFSDLHVHHTNALYVRIGETTIAFKGETFTSVLYATIGVCVVTLVLSTSVRCCVFVCGTALSVIFALMGYFQLMGQRFDGSMLAVTFVAIGVSVDYSAHYAFTYTGKHVRDTCRNTRERMEYTMKAVGGPIILGCLTSLAGIACFANGRTDLHRVMFNAGWFVILSSTYHGLVVLPVLLLIVDDVADFFRRRRGSAEKSAEEPVSKRGVVSSVLGNGDSSKLSDWNLAHINPAFTPPENDEVSGRL